MVGRSKVHMRALLYNLFGFIFYLFFNPRLYGNHFTTTARLLCFMTRLRCTHLLAFSPFYPSPTMNENNKPLLSPPPPEFRPRVRSKDRDFLS